LCRTAPSDTGFWGWNMHIRLNRDETGYYAMPIGLQNHDVGKGGATPPDLQVIITYDSVYGKRRLASYAGSVKKSVGDKLYLLLGNIGDGSDYNSEDLRLLLLSFFDLATTRLNEDFRHHGGRLVFR